MPWWRTYYNRRRRRWRRRFWPRRPRRTFWRKHYRRRRLRVRKKKKISIQQWQPHFIRRVKVKGFYPMTNGTNERIGNNLNLYLETAAPHYLHGGGCFSINNFSLETLYKEHVMLRNVWTRGNQNMPLFKYSGCKITLYNSTNVDWLFYYNNSYPMKSDLTMYQSCQPYVMLLNNHTIVIPCKENNNNKRKFKKIKIPPPTQMYNRWYFARDIAQIPLLQTMATQCSLDRMFSASTAISTTIGLQVLDITYWTNHQFTQLPTTGYVPKPNTLIFGLPNGATNITKVKFSSLIFLGNTDDYFKGQPISAETGKVGDGNDFQKKVRSYSTKKTMWGNPFRSGYFYGEERMLTTNLTWNQLINTYNTDGDLGTNFTLLTSKYHEVRYNPYKDKGIGNKIYMLPIDKPTNNYDWSDTHADKDSIAENLPLWSLFFGYIDFQKRWEHISSVETKHIIVFQTQYIQTQAPKTFVLLDIDFLHGHSPYRPEGEITPSDYNYWHPKVAFQERSINDIISTGPATSKLPDRISGESHIKYCFYFKVGGNPAPMSIIEDPDDQPKFPTPDNMFPTTSLQNPTTPFQQFLWNFDERRNTITQKAIKRIQDYTEPETNLLSITETSSSYKRPRSPETSSPETSDSEKEETPEEKISRYRREQKLLKRGINRLLNRLANLE
nr:MAG: ORF1 [TTV-like mini virus]